MMDLSMGHAENSGLLIPPLVPFVTVRHKRINGKENI